MHREAGRWSSVLESLREIEVLGFGGRSCASLSRILLINQKSRRGYGMESTRRWSINFAKL